MENGWRADRQVHFLINQTSLRVPITSQPFHKDNKPTFPYWAFVSSFTHRFMSIRIFRSDCMIRMTFPAISWPWHSPISTAIVKIDFSWRLFVIASITTDDKVEPFHSSAAVAINHCPACRCISSPPHFYFAFHSSFSHPSTTIQHSSKTFRSSNFHLSNYLLFAYASI